MPQRKDHQSKNSKQKQHRGGGGGGGGSGSSSGGGGGDAKRTGVCRPFTLGVGGKRFTSKSVGELIAPATLARNAAIQDMVTAGDMAGALTAVTQFLREVLPTLPAPPKDRLQPMVAHDCAAACFAVHERTLCDVIWLCVKAGTARDILNGLCLFMCMRKIWLRSQHCFTPSGATLFKYNAPFQHAFGLVYGATVRTPPEELASAAGAVEGAVPLVRDALAGIEAAGAVPLSLPAHGVDASALPASLTRRWVRLPEGDAPAAAAAADAAAAPAAAAASAEAGELRLMTLNVCAQYLTDLFSFQFVMPQPGVDFLSWRHRLALLCASVAGQGPEVLALQEVDTAHWPELEAHMAKLGYAGVFAARYNARTERALDDGCAVLYRADRWLLRHSTATPAAYTERAQAAPTGGLLIALLQRKDAGAAAGQVLGVASLHVHWDRRPGEVVRIADLLREEAAPYSAACVLAGDTNGMSEEEVAELTARDFTDPYAQHAGLAVGEGGTLCTCHDNVYHSGGYLDILALEARVLRPRALLQLPADEPALRRQGGEAHPARSLPHASALSDHIEVGCDVQWLAAP